MEENEPTRNNQEVCPNCLEPNSGDLANCAFCGMPLHDDPESLEIQSENPDLNANSEKNNIEIIDKPSTGKPKDEKDGKINRGFTYAMRGMGIYLVVYSVSELPRSFKIADSQNRKLAILGDIIYLIAGCLMAWPLLKDYLQKRKEKQQDVEPIGKRVVDESDYSKKNSDSPLEADVIDYDPPKESSTGGELIEDQQPSGPDEDSENRQQ
ncbi:MAG: hypothetical protein AB9907_12025 [Flexilinea sp.]